MSGMKDTLAGLTRLQREMEALRASGGNGLDGSGKPQRLIEIADFGANPGNLRMLSYASPRLAPKPALVVALHGCAQTAASYDHCSGWSVLAERQGFVLVCPEQRQANNPNMCFNWFAPAHTRRESGEAGSIRQMVAHAIETYGADPAQVFVVGLSAGGAMTNAMLASYPDVFSAGAVIAGLPFGAASNVSDALQMMAKGRNQPARVWGQLVREAAAQHDGPWPRLSIWHGDNDMVVHPANAEASLAQWVNVHGIAPPPTMIETLAGHRRRVWLGCDQKPAVEAWSVAGMAHAVPLGADDGDSLGMAGAFHSEVGLASTARIASFWGIAATLPAPQSAATANEGAHDQVADVIKAALQQAGLAGGKVGQIPDPRAVAQKAGEQATAMLRRLGLLKD